MLAVAAGLALPDAPNAAAERYHGGYTYTARTCQEYGQQPRYYNVRDGQAAYNGGNSDSGWLIVLIRTANIIPASFNFGAATYSGGWGTVQDSLDEARDLVTPPHSGAADPKNPVGSLIKASDGTWGFVQNVGRWIVVDRDKSGELDAGDMVLNAGAYDYIERSYIQTGDPVNYGAQYIRWAHMAWCR